MHDVVVVGAGPAGLYTACLLAQTGVDVLVLEEHETVGRPTHCTGLVSEETYTFFKIPDDAVLARPSTCVVVAPSGTRYEFEYAGEQLLVIDRAAFDQALAASACAAGAVVATGCAVDRVEIESDHVVAVTTTGRHHAARALVLACGVTYRFQRQLGFGLPIARLHTAQVEVDAVSFADIEVHVGRRVAPEGFAWLVPLRRAGRARVKAGILLRGDADAHLRAFLRAPSVEGRITESPGDAVRRLLPVGPVARSYANRVVAVGDAAGLTKPTTGGGVFYSLVSARCAAEVLADALAADDLGEERLARYEQLWRARLMPELQVGGWLRRLLARVPDRGLDALAAALASADVQAVIREAARFNWHGSAILALLRRTSIRPALLGGLIP